MRLLSIELRCPADPWWGEPAGDLLLALTAAGHDARRLEVDSLAPPAAAGDKPGGPTSNLFLGLSDQQFADCRQHCRTILDRAVRDFDPHVLLVRGLWLHAALALETGVPYIVTAIGPDLAAYREDPRLKRLVEQGAINASQVIANSQALRLELLAAFPELADVQVLLDPCGLSSEVAAPPIADKADRLIVAVGTSPADSNWEPLLNAAAVYQALDVTTTIIARAGQRPELEWQANRLGLERVSWQDNPLDAAAQRRLFAQADLVVETSRVGLSLREVQEALSAGTPVVASAVGGFPELIDDGVGALIPTGDHERLAESICRLLESNAKMRMATVCRQRVAKRCSPRVVASGYAEFCQAALLARNVAGRNG